MEGAQVAYQAWQRGQFEDVDNFLPTSQGGMEPRHGALGGAHDPCHHGRPTEYMDTPGRRITTSLLATPGGAELPGGMKGEQCL